MDIRLDVSSGAMYHPRPLAHLYPRYILKALPYFCSTSLHGSDLVQSLFFVQLLLDQTSCDPPLQRKEDANGMRVGSTAHRWPSEMVDNEGGMSRKHVSIREAVHAKSVLVYSSV